MHGRAELQDLGQRTGQKRACEGSQLRSIERGEVNITVEKLYRIANVLDCEPQLLLPESCSLHELASDLEASN
ncbi:helix-turn-helix domain-containing protein [Pseudomonas sp. Irchel 3A7]|uniref:helix-turn-helix domain-containing protein n=1 Tax=Pseudomonas sp. Irchel 3A7 TaxID=2008913 RepID=UPI00353250C5